MTSGKRQRRSCSIKKKLQILKFIVANPDASLRAVGEKFDVDKSTVDFVDKHKAELTAIQIGNANLNSTRIEKDNELNKKVWHWFQLARAKGAPLNGSIIKEKALQYSQQLGDHTFKASDGWLNSFKTRHQICEKVISGESGAADTASAAQWKSTLRELCQGYEQKDIFNLDETGYFYRSLPDRTLAAKRDECKGGKYAKDRITVVLACSMTGQKLKPWIIGKSENPRCMRVGDAERLNCIYKSSAKAWMTRSLFSEYLDKLNEEMRIKNRRILLFLDNAPVHFGPESGQYSNIKLIFFPPNMTCLLQPLDAGIIRSFKVRARKHSTLKVLAQIEGVINVEYAASLAKKFTVLDALKFVSLAWNEVTAETIKACFSNCGFLEVPLPVVPDVEEENLRQIVERVGIRQIEVEENLDCFISMETDEDFERILSSNSADNVEETEEAEEADYDPPMTEQLNDLPVTKMTFSDVKSSLLHIANYFDDNGMVEKSSVLRFWHHELCISEPPNVTQSKISKFFKFISK